MAVRKVISADFATCWAKFMSDGKGAAFNKSASEILQRSQKGVGGENVAREVLKNYTSISPGTGVDPAIKVAIGCLNAIRSFPSSVDEDGNGPLRWVLTGANEIGRDLSTRPRSAEDEALLTEELRQLFALKVDPARLSSSAAGGQRSAQDIMASYALRGEEMEEMGVKGSGSNEAEGDAGAAGFAVTGRQDAKKMVKSTASLTLAAFRIFPFLTSLRVGPEAVNNFLATLTSTGAWGSAISVLEQYPAQTSVASFEALFRALSASAEWERLAELALAVRTLLHAASPHSLPAGSFASVAGGNGSIGTSSETSTGSGVGVGGPFLAKMAPEELKERVVGLIQLCINANTTTSLSAAKKLAVAYKLHELSTMIQEVEQTLKFQAVITKGKWQILVQQLERGGSMAKKIKFYNMLVQHEKYMEAADTYRLLRLHGSAAVPVNRAQLEAQAVYHRDNFLGLAPTLLDSVLVINSQRSLEQAAREMGLSLQPYVPVPPSPAASGENASEKGEKGAGRAVTFQSLLKDLQQPSPPLKGKSEGVQTGARRFFNGQYRLVVGLDCEWRACVQQDLSGNGCSILQIATPNKIYIVDFRTLCPERENSAFRPSHSPRGKAPLPTPPRPVPGTGAVVGDAPAPPSLKEQTRHLLQHLFSDPRVLKVGWDFLSEDIRMLRKNSKGAFIESVAELHSYLETKDVGAKLLQQTQPTEHKQAAKSSSLSADDHSGTDATARVKVNSLSAACGEFLGRPLLKMEQMSNWDQRPLSRAQVQYAALDAHATLSLLDAYLQRAGVQKDALLRVANRYYLSPAPATPVRTSTAKAPTTGKKK